MNRMHQATVTTRSSLWRRMSGLIARAVLLVTVQTARGVYFPPPVTPTPQSAPFIYQQPDSATLTPGEWVDLYVLSMGNPTPTIQWRKDGVAIPGAKFSCLSLSNVQSADAGRYDATVTNKYGTATSNVATIKVVPAVAPYFTTQPASKTFVSLPSLTLTVAADGMPAPTLQWRRNGENIRWATSKELTLTISTPGTYIYDVVATNRVGSVISDAAVITVLRNHPTVISAQPASMLAGLGATATLAVNATGDNLRYQWKKNGAVIAGAPGPICTLASVTAADMGFYSVVVTGDGGVVESDGAVLTVSTGGRSPLTNLSSRSSVPARGELTVGFALRGSSNKPLLVRAVGPTLSQLGVPGALVDPKLEVFSAGSLGTLLANDNWENSATLVNAVASVGAFALPSGSKDAAVFGSLAPGAYSARITSAVADGSGIVLAEVYDRDSAVTTSRLTNLSTLAHVGAGSDSALVSGFVIGGTAPKQILIRAVGPGLGQLGILNPLGDPQLTVIPAGLSLTVARNDNWGGDAALAAAFAQVGAFALARDSKDAALVVRLPPGGYTVTVSGVGDTTGPALVEIYDLDP